VTAIVTGLALPVSAGPVHSGGPWTFTQGPITCQFSGGHSAVGGVARATTDDYNGGCARLRARLKYTRASDGVVVSLGWTTTVGSPPQLIYTAGVASTANSSEHRAENGWIPSWSAVQRPHAW
jgi:hypothetical protein